MEIAEATEEHLKEMGSIYKEEKSAEPFNESWTDESAYTKIKLIFDDKESKSFVAIEDGNVIGFAMVTRTYWSRGWGAQLRKIFVAKTHQGKGIGSKLLIKAEEYCREIGCKFIDLHAYRKSKAMDFYKKHGYKEDGWISMDKNL